MYLCSLNTFVVMLCWFARRDVAEAALHGDRMLKASDIKRNPKTAACLDSNVCLKAIQKYCETPAWHAVERIAEDLQKEGLWYCAMCTLALNDDDDDCVACDGCLQWYHFTCAGVRSAPKAKIWFCKGCKLA